MPALLAELQTAYAARGVNLRQRDGSWAFRTAEDLAFVLQQEVVEQKKLSRAALETLAIIAYHQPVTRAEIEEIRGVAISRGTLDVLLEAGWIRLRGRRRTPGRPVTFGTTPAFLDHFGLERIGDLPGLADLKAAGLLEAALPRRARSRRARRRSGPRRRRGSAGADFDEFGPLRDRDEASSDAGAERGRTARGIGLPRPTSDTERPCRAGRRVP